MEHNALRKLYIDELRDLYDAESRLVKALPRLAKAATSVELRAAIEEHLEQTRGHVDRLMEIFDTFGEKPGGEKCAGMMGLIKEGGELVDADFEGMLGLHHFGGKIPRPIAADENLRGMLANFVAHAVDWALCHEISVTQEDDLIRDGIDLVKNVTRNNHVTTLCRYRTEESDHLRASQRVEAV